MKPEEDGVKLDDDVLKRLEEARKNDPEWEKAIGDWAAAEAAVSERDDPAQGVIVDMTDDQVRKAQLEQFAANEAAAPDGSLTFPTEQEALNHLQGDTNQKSEQE